jgi:hypothetical protein
MSGMTGERLHVLLLDQAGGGAAGAIDALVAAGHVVSRCAAIGPAVGRCNTLAAGEPCPLDATPVDVVLELRVADAAPHTGFVGRGSCAQRNGVPLVVVPSADDVVAACEQAASGGPGSSR